MKTISLKIDEGLDRWLQDEAQRLRRSKSEIARQALQHQRDGKQGPSVHDLMKDVCGSIKDGPKDVARNQRKYMKGFGQ